MKKLTDHEKVIQYIEATLTGVISNMDLRSVKVEAIEALIENGLTRDEADMVWHKATAYRVPIVKMETLH